MGESGLGTGLDNGAFQGGQGRTLGNGRLVDSKVGILVMVVVDTTHDNRWFLVAHTTKGIERNLKDSGSVTKSVVCSSAPYKVSNPRNKSMV